MADPRAPNDRTVALAAALLAITLLALQPLVHAASMRDDPGARSLWRSLCLATDEETDERGAMPIGGKAHACCLGLPHAWAVAAPDVAFTRVEPVASRGPAVVVQRRVPATGIRDGPLQPRAPPFLA